MTPRRERDRESYRRRRTEILKKRRAAYAANREAALATLTAYRLANRARILERRRRNYAAHHAEKRAAAIAYEIEHRERRKAQHQAWLLAHPERTRAYDRQRHAINPYPKRLGARKRKAMLRGNKVGRIDYRLIIATSGGKCGICGRRVAVKDRSFDHIVPLSHGGEHSQHNLRLTHLVCNLRRGNRTPAQPYLAGLLR